MKNSVFSIDNFNVISDDKYYYAFRALNTADSNDISNGITLKNNKINRIRTDRERWEEEKGKKAKYDKDGEISLEEMFDHIKMHYIKETNCISLSSNSNVSLVYGQGYNDEYAIVKIPKENIENVYNAGQYMLEKVQEEIEKIILELPKDSEILKVIENIDKLSEHIQIQKYMKNVYKNVKTSGKYTGEKGTLNKKNSIIDRLNTKQYFSNVQQVEYDKIIAKLTTLETYGKLKNIIKTTKDNTSLIQTIGNAFSSGELIHYKDINESEIIPISKNLMDIFSVLQQVKDNDKDNKKINKIEEKIIHLANEGYDLVEKDGRLIFSNGNQEIDLKEANNTVLLKENNYNINEESNIEKIYKLTNGTMNYEKAKKAVESSFYLSKSKVKAYEIVEVLELLMENKEEYREIFENIKKQCFSIDSNIIKRQNNKGRKICESVNIDMNEINREFLTYEEQKKLIEIIENTDKEDLQEIIISGGINIQQSIFDNALERTEKKSENRYFAEAIIDSMDFSKIYKNAISEDRKVIKDSEREILLKKLESADCKRLYKAFENAGIEHSQISGYIINLLMNNGYKGFKFEELSRVEGLDEIISTNVKNNMIKCQIIPFKLDELLKNVDNENEIEGTNIKLRDYQKETIDNLETIYEKKRFAGVVLPTGAGKSFIAISEMLKNKDKNILYFAPQIEILNQVERHILKNILGIQVLTKKEIEELDGKEAPNGKIYPTEIKKYISTIFPHLKMYCYQSLAERSEEFEEKDLRKILANSDADFMIFDEVHRAGAETWEPLIKKMMQNNPNSKILGITATPIRDYDKKDMMETLAHFSGDYTKDELINGDYLAKEMYLIDAIQDYLVVEPNIVSFNYSLAESEEYQEIQKIYNDETDPVKKEKIKNILNDMDAIINDYSDINKMIMNETNSEKKKELKEKFDEMRKKISTENTQGIGNVIKSNIVKKDGRYIVFLPHNSTELSTEEYIKKEIEKVKEYLKDIDDSPEIQYLVTGQSKVESVNAISNFEDSNSEHLKLLFAIDKLNEGVHVDGINGEIMFRKIGEGSKILYLQQLGRVIFSLDPNNPISQEEIPIVFDVYNNYIVHNMNKEVNKKNSTSDLQRLQSIVNWINKHGYFPDINSEILSENRKANELKKIQIKYKKYLNGINNKKLSKREIHEIEKIIELARSINLFEMEIPEKIVKSYEENLYNVQLFKVSGSQKRFLELYKEATKTVKTEKLNSNHRIRTTLDILQTLTDYGLDINNQTIPRDALLEDVLKNVPEYIKNAILDEIDENLDYNIGKEYNETKLAFRNSNKNNIFLDYDIRDLRMYGIFEEAVKDPSKKDKNICDVVKDGWIIDGNKKMVGLNINTGTCIDEEGYDREGYDLEGYDREGYDRKGWNREHINKETNDKYNLEGYNIYGYDKEGYDKEGYDKEGYDKEGYEREGYDKEGYDKEEYDKEGYDKEGYNK